MYHCASGNNNFTSCSCITESSYALRQNCDNNCSYFIPFLVIMFVLRSTTIGKRFVFAVRAVNEIVWFVFVVKQFFW